MPTLLALDTATEACSVALLHDGQLLSHYEVIPRLHAQKLLPMIEHIMAEAGVPLAALDAIAFGRGPGAFTGVRIAIGVVQGLAFALERPVLGISNLAALAQGAWRREGHAQVAAAIDARMDEVYWGCYRQVDGEMRLCDAEAVLPPHAVRLPADNPEGWYGAGTGWGYADRLAVQLSQVDAAALPHAQDVLALAGYAWARGEAIDAEHAQPVYLRDNVATPKGAPRP